ncbi:uncharacterized protein MAL13P1.304 [Eurosta solidaginis]|uniref:uncharacterized protein MAL13P1.304 n=1 Tax=Eurosta solidaginis TaxID=178769 RepID=UPI0035309A91
MGAKQTKIEGTYLPDTPIILTNSTPNAAVDNEKYDCKNFDAQDPRSPNICRTPISILTNFKCAVSTEGNKMSHTESAIGQLRRKFFKGFSYNLNDPRSPGYHFNRTQINFDDSQDKILNLDDTFADLFAETQAHAGLAEEQRVPDNLQLSTKNEDVQNKTNGGKENCDTKVEEEHELSTERIEELSNTDVEEEAKDLSIPSSSLQRTPNHLQDEIDPRSPTIGVDRTPIIFNDDDDETNESVLLESILATLSLNMSDVSICSIGSTNVSPSKQNGESYRNDSRQGQLFRKITHNRMRRTRANEKIPLKTRRLAKDVQKSPPRVFEDSENILPNAMNGRAFKLKSKNSAPGSNIKRTPLSCIKNSGNLQLRSAKMSVRSLNDRLDQSNDDSLVLEP